MPSRRRRLKSEGSALPPPPTFSKGSFRLSEKGLLTFAEIAVGSVIIALLIVVAVSTLRVTEKGTISQKQRQQALNLAKGRSEELKSYLNSEKWDYIKADVRYPPTQTPAVNTYNSYAPQTVLLGKNSFILDPEIRFVNADNTNQIQLIPTPGNASTPEISEMIRIRVDAYYGPVSEFQPLPTAEAKGPLQNRMVYTNLLAHNQVDVGGVGQISGYVYTNCINTQPVTATAIQVGLFQGVQQIQSALTDNYGFFSFTSVPAGVMNLQIVSCPGYQPVAGYSCNFTNPITLVAGSSLNNLWLGVTPLAVQAYYGVVVKSTPVFSPVIPTSPTPTPNPAMTAIPVAGAVVFANDGNSEPVTSNASGAYTITQVQATPVGTHPYDTIEADSWALTMLGKNYNTGSGMTTGNFVSGGVQYLGPITIFVNAAITNIQPVTFYCVAEDLSNLNGSYNPVTLSVQDGSASPPSTIFNSPGPATLWVNQGAPIVNVSLGNNTSPPRWTTFNQSVVVDATLNHPLTLLNYSVGSAAGTLTGLGAFDYTLFKVQAHDDVGQFFYSIPVSWDGAATFGTFQMDNMRAPLPGGGAPGQLHYDFVANGGGDYTSSTSYADVRQGNTIAQLDNPIFISALNVYANVTVTKGGAAYPYGSWISAQNGSLAAPPTTGLGSGYSVTSYFSTVTKGDGTGQVQVQLISGTSTTYTFFAQIVDPTSYALSTKAVTVTMTTADNFANPHPVTFTFP